jgi:Na+-transporting NADH:ubiquinone oxidoreductase subunit NqrE
VVDGVVLVEVLVVLVEVRVVLVEVLSEVLSEVLGYFSPSVSSSSSIVASVLLAAARVVSVSSCTGSGSGMYNKLLIQKCAEAYVPGTPATYSDKKKTIVKLLSLHQNI